MLEDSYHLAAIEIAKTQRTWITFWSVVEASGDDVFLQAFISIVPVVRERVPLLDVEVDATPVQGLSIDMPRTRFGFRIQKVTKRLLNPNGLKVFTKRSAGLRQGARENSDIVVELPSNKQALVLEMEGEWLYVRVTDPSKTGYLNLEDVLPVAGPRRLELPVIEFIAGLIAYQAGNYEKGRGHFKTFIEKAGPDEDRANLAAAHQMLGAISLRRNALDESALHDFDSAISLTPYDPHAYLLRSVAQVGYSREADVDVLAYVEKALELDHLNPTARALISAFAKVNAQSNPKIAVTFEPGALTGIQKKYGIAPR